LFTSEDLKDVVADTDDWENTARANRTLLREFRTLLGQPEFSDVETLGELKQRLANSAADSYGVVRSNRDKLIALIDSAREDGSNYEQFNDSLFHLFRLTDMQVMFVRGMREFFGSPVVTELSNMMDNERIAAMNEILTSEDDEAGT